MDLFRINRYMGEETEYSQENETLKLARLQQQIKERVKMRQRERLEGQQTKTILEDRRERPEKENVAAMSDSKKKKKTRKRSRADEAGVKEKEKTTNMDKKERKEKGKRKKQKLEKHKLEKPTRSLSQEEGDVGGDDDDDDGDDVNNGLNDDGEQGLTTAKNEDLANQSVVEESKIIENRKLDASGFTVIGGRMKAKQVQKVQRVLPEWLAKPTIIDSDLKHNLIPVDELKCLDQKLIKKLTEKKIQTFFPVQNQVIPVILSRLDKNSVYGCNGYQPPDVCVSAPTGSGKTLAYALPVIQTIMNRVVRRLQALIILPTKDLAGQVKQVFCTFTEGTGLRVGAALGEKSFPKEQEQLIDTSQGGTASRVDILVATPGRLVDHITSTPEFTLKHLRFLVIDEADRLLDQAFHGWLNKVLKAAYKRQDDFPDFTLGPNNRFPICRLNSLRQPPCPISPCSLSRINLPLQKLLFSATLTHNPEKLAPLQLYQPIFFLAHSMPNDSAIASIDINDKKEHISARYCVPAGLTEYMTVCENGEKPLVVLYLVMQLKLQQILCFASSVESTHRLYLLLKLFGGMEVAEYSSSLTPQRRRAILRDFRKGKIQLLVCSDAMARGMDIENVKYVVSYDAPNFVKTYIHRVGRTARAGNTGTAFTLLHSEEVYHFKQIIRKTGREKIARYNVKQKELEPLVENYQVCLERLRETLNQEKLGTSQSKGRSATLRLIQKQITENLTT